MAKNLHIPRRRLSTNDLLKTLVLRAANARPGRPTPEHHPPNFTMVRRKPSKPPAGRSFLEKIPISSSRGRSIIRKCNADSRLIFDEEPIGDSRGRSIIHKYALNAKKLYFPDVIPTSSSFGYSIVHKCNANPGPRAKGGDPRMEKKVDLEGDTGTYPPLPHNADGIVRRVSGASHFTALREHYVQDLKKQELGALGPTTTGNKIAEELAGATKRYQEYLRMSRRDVYFRRPLVRNYVRYHGSTSTMETVRRASTVAGKTPLKPVDMDVERYHKLADKYIDELVAKFEAMQEEREDVDCEYSSGVLTLTFPPHGTYVLNKQPPNKQIWLSSPISGPKRYDYVLSSPEDTSGKEEKGEKEGKEEKGEWMYLRDESTLSQLLEEEVGVVVGQGKGEGVD